MPRILHNQPIIWLFLWLFLQAGLLAQQPVSAGKDANLISLLRQAETRFQVKFSFADKDVRGLSLKLASNAGLQELLEEIPKQTGLNVQKLNDRYYSLFAPKTIRLCGLILDNYKERVTGASIQVLGSTIATVSAEDGTFRLEGIPREATLKIQHLGFKSQFLQAGRLRERNPCVSVILGVSYQELQEVVVYKFLTTGLSREADGSIQMNPSDFGLLPGLTEPDVLQTIQALPGIKSIDETVSDINIRGGTNDQNLLLWDGIKMYQSGHFFGLISAFNPYLTEEVEIIKNGASARYGDGLSGIISMQTYDEVQRTFSGGGGFNLISADLYGHIPIGERLAIQFSARRSVTDFLNTPTYSQFSDRAFQNTEISTPGSDASSEIAVRDQNFYFYDFSGKILYDLTDRHRLRFNFLYVDNNLAYSETLSADRSENKSLLDQTNFAAGARLQSDWNTALSTEILVYHTRYNLDSELRIQNNSQQLFQLNQVNENVLKAHLRYRFNDLVQWNSGYQFLETGVNNTTEVSQPPFQSRIKNLIYTHAVFTEWTYQGPGKRLITTAGLRLNYLYNPKDFNEFYLEPRLNLQYKLSGYLTLGVLGELKNQATHQIVDLEQNFLGIEKRRWILADGKTLPVATSLQGSTGLHYDRGYWAASLEGFYKEVDGISTDTQGFQNEDQFNGEIGRYRVYGVEALINYKSETWSTWLSYAYNKNNYTFDELQPSTFPNNLDIRHTTTLGINYTYGGLKIGAGLNYRTGRPFTQPFPPPDEVDTSVVPSRINYSQPNSSLLPEYFRVDASALYSFRLSESVKASVGVSVLNLTSRRNVLNTYYRLNTQDVVEKVESISLGLTPNASFRIRF